MSLADAVTDIADEMEASIKDWIEDRKISLILLGYVRQIRTAVKAVEGAAPAAVTVNPMALSPGAQHAIEIEKARAEFRAKRTEAEEDVPEMISFKDGPFLGAQVSVSNKMPVGAATEYNGIWHVRRADGLYLSPERNKEAQQLAEKKLILPSQG